MTNIQIFNNKDFGEIEVNGKLKPIGFKVIKGYDNFYCINHFGDIISPSYTDKNNKFRRMRLIKPTTTKKGYLRVHLNLNGKQVKRYVHRLVGKTFIPNKDNKPQINHIDGDKLNNHISNLEWCTNQENIIHSYKTGLRVGTNATGERNTMAKLTEKQVLEIIGSDLKVNCLADKFKVSKSCIYKIKQKKRVSV